MMRREETKEVIKVKIERGKSKKEMVGYH